jgi:hypothetical protein
VSPLSPSILNRHPSILALLLVACTGTDGTLVVRHDAGGGAPTGAAGAASVAENPYIPPANARWLVQLDGAVDIEQEADFFYLDPEQQDPDDLATLRAQGRPYLCYLSAGSVESFRDDAADFPVSAIGNPLENFPRERWLDVRDSAVRGLMAKRVAGLSAFGCAGVPPSSLSVQVADTGFDLSLTDALDYARWLAERIHAAGMSAGLTGPATMTAELWGAFDFGLAISCVNGSGCSEYAPFESAKKTVLHLEVGDERNASFICNAAKSLGFYVLVSDPGFTGHAIACSDLP